MLVIRTSVVKTVLLHKLVLLIIVSYCCDHCKAFQLLPFNVIDGIDKIGNFLEADEKVPKLVNEIADIVADGGLDKYRSGQNNEDKDLNITQLIQKYSRTPEVHHVNTNDGYILTLFRIPGNGSAVFLMHGIVCTADCFVTAGPGSALPYLLAEQGYDVWLGNARGTTHSRKHEHLSPSCAEFWDFSWDEIGRYDLPAMIDYVLQVTGQRQLKYVGHSQGTTAFFVMCSERPDYNDKISLMVSLSSVVWMSHLISPIPRLLAPFNIFVDILLAALGVYELVPSDALTKTLSRGLCGNTEFANIICSNFNFLISGFNYAQLNVTNMPVVFSHTPGGLSKKQLVHYAQEINSGKFCRYDYGESKNLKVYGSADPPDYPVEKVTAPVAIFYSLRDWISNVTDVEILVGKIKNVVDYHEVKNFSHNDYMWAKDVKELVYLRVLDLIGKF